MKSGSPKVTVLMPVYNAEKHLNEAIDSILNQTFTDYEFLIINDGSTDNSKNIILSYQDPRIRLVENNLNIGLTKSLNKGIDLSTGTYIARMDCDDISLPDRLQKQVAYMDANPDIDICGTWFRYFGNTGERTVFLPENHEDIKCGLLFYTTMAHPSIIIRKKKLLENNLYYDPAYISAQDYELWVRSLKYLRYHNIGETLLLYRLHDKQVGHRDYDRQFTSARLVLKTQLKNLLITPTEEDLDMHQSLCTGIFEQNENFLTRVEKWLYMLQAANRKLRFYSDTAFEYLIHERWIRCCYRVHGFSLLCIIRLFSSAIFKETENKYSIIMKLLFISNFQKIRSRLFILPREVRFQYEKICLK